MAQQEEPKVKAIVEVVQIFKGYELDKKGNRTQKTHTVEAGNELEAELLLEEFFNAQHKEKPVDQENQKPETPPEKPTPTPINEEKDFGKLEEQTDRQDNPRVAGHMDADAAVSEAPPARSGPLPPDEQAYFDQQAKERNGQS